MDVLLVMFKSDGTRRDFTVSKDRMVIGRKNTCDLRIPLTSVSRQHCEVAVDGAQVKLRDLGSSNGTFHNSIRVQEAVLEPGDEIVVGPVVFTLVVDGKPADIKAVKTIVVKTDESGSEMTTGGEDALEAIPAGESIIEAIPMDDDVLEAPVAEDDEALTPTIDVDEEPLDILEAMDESGETQAFPDDESGEFKLVVDDE